MAKPAQPQWIRDIFEEVEEEYPNESEEWLYAMTIEVYRQRYGEEIDNGDIAYALAYE